MMKKTTIKNLRAEARAVLAAYKTDADFGAVVDRLAAIGARLAGKGAR